MLEEILVTKTSDGKLFEDKREAEKYEREFQIKEKMMELVHNFYYRGIDSEDIVDELIAQIPLLKEILSIK